MEAPESAKSVFLESEGSTVFQLTTWFFLAAFMLQARQGWCKGTVTFGELFERVTTNATNFQFLQRVNFTLGSYPKQRLKEGELVRQGWSQLLQRATLSLFSGAGGGGGALAASSIHVHQYA